MSKDQTSRRPRRSDAAANEARILAAALALLADGTDPSMAEVSAAAGVSRQTVYSHYPSRKALIAAVRSHLTAASSAALAGDLPAEPVAGLHAWLSRAWQLIDAYPALLNPVLFAAADDQGDVVVEHEPVIGGLRRVLAVADADRVLADDASPDWLVAAVIALGHAAGQEVAAGRLGAAEAGAAFRSGALRLCVAPQHLP